MMNIRFGARTLGVGTGVGAKFRCFSGTIKMLRSAILVSTAHHTAYIYILISNNGKSFGTAREERHRE
jgi:hypothetical protein